ncbi:MAG: phospholipase D-like domain-containing protein, partial [Oscillospiraceae bacterium]|nr:phospholipase D-like domain-containing protein [Oscillospiraceae bacterium]
MRAARKILSLLISRMVFVALMILLQIAALLAAVDYFSQNFFYFYLACFVLSILVVLAMLSRHENPAFKVVWIVAIMAFPVFGGIFYLCIANRRIPGKLEKKLEDSHLGVHQWLPRGDVAPDDPHHQQQSEYIQRITGYPLWEYTSVQYFPVGEVMFEDMMRQVEKAEHYIFLEYFIVRPGYMWDVLLEALKRKAAGGVAVYMMYDDVGSIASMNRRRGREIREAGIKLQAFNKFRPHVSTLLNSRDHRKVMVVDGKTAFCGGINIADEYINKIKRLGHWKDTGVRLSGRA